MAEEDCQRPTTDCRNRERRGDKSGGALIVCPNSDSYKHEKRESEERHGREQDQVDDQSTPATGASNCPWVPFVLLSHGMKVLNPRADATRSRRRHRRSDTDAYVPERRFDASPNLSRPASLIGSDRWRDDRPAPHPRAISRRDMRVLETREGRRPRLPPIPATHRRGRRTGPIPLGLARRPP